jgi:hypothetical protein
MKSVNNSTYFSTDKFESYNALTHYTTTTLPSDFGTVGNLIECSLIAGTFTENYYGVTE